MILFCKAFRFPLCLVCLSVAGCQTALNVATRGVITQYSPGFATKSSVDQYEQMIKGVEKDTVSDDAGSYYHEVEDGYVYKVFLNAKDEVALGNEFLNGVGLLAPALRYVYGQGNDPIVWADMEFTQIMHQKLSANLGLNLMPMDETINYLESVQELSERSNYRYSGSTHKAILDYAGVSPDYLISVGGVERYYNNYVNWKRGARYDEPDEIKIFYNEVLTRGNNIYFLPKALLDNSSGTGLYLNSGCIGIDLPLYRGKFRRSSESPQALYRLVAESHGKRKAQLLDRCIVGLKELGVVGAIRSERLE